MNLLTIESTCDETAAAVIRQIQPAADLEVLGAVVASQDDLHQQFSGVVPEIAARAHVERILPVIDETLRRADITLSDLDAIAVAHTPGLVGSLLVGVTAAKMLSLSLKIPLVAVNHLHAHIYACRIAAQRDLFPCVGLIVSGGHSSVYRCEGPCEFEYLGGTIDDAAGEAFDKVASMLGLPYPGGPAISKVAVNGDRAAYPFPRSFIHDKKRLDFSFSGLKTAVRYEIAGPGRPDFSAVNLTEKRIADIAASFEEAVVDCLVAKATLACEQTESNILCVGGGVAANGRLRTRLTEAAETEGIELHIAPFHLCTDNAIMGAIAVERLHAGLTEDLSLEVKPGLVRS